MRTRAAILIGVLVLLTAAVMPVVAQDAIRTGEIVKIDQSAKTFTVKTSRGETLIETTAKTVVKEGEKTIAFADLKVGDQVRVSGIRKSASVEASEIVKQAP
jgi:hypothetical protein